MGSEKIQVETCQEVGILTTNNPPANAHTSELRQEFINEFIEVSKNDGIWTLIRTGAGEKFFPKVAKEMEIAPSEREVADILGGSAAKILKITS